jgi:glycosyltransferase involved in cell wall biosynthesis
VGDGLLRDAFKERIAKLGLTDRFIFTGLVSPERVCEFTAAMDVLVHPSRREGLARALPQGALAGCPVVTYDVDGNREGLLDEKTGFLIAPFDKVKLAQALRVLMADPGLRRSMGEGGRAFALSRFDTRVMVDGLERVYREAAESVRTG